MYQFFVEWEGKQFFLIQTGGDCVKISYRKELGCLFFFYCFQLLYRNGIRSCLRRDNLDGREGSVPSGCRPGNLRETFGGVVVVGDLKARMAVMARKGVEREREGVVSRGGVAALHVRTPEGEAHGEGGLPLVLLSTAGLSEGAPYSRHTLGGVENIAFVCVLLVVGIPHLSS